MEPRHHRRRPQVRLVVGHLAAHAITIAAYSIESTNELHIGKPSGHCQVRLLGRS
jgi:hypothetical protein